MGVVLNRFFRGLGLGVFCAFVLIGSPVRAQPLPVPGFCSRGPLRGFYDQGLRVGEGLAAVRLYGTRGWRSSEATYNRLAPMMLANMRYLHRLIENARQQAHTNFTDTPNAMLCFSIGVGLRSNHNFRRVNYDEFSFDHFFHEYLPYDRLLDGEFLSGLDDPNRRIPELFAAIERLIADAPTTPNGDTEVRAGRRFFWREHFGDRFPGIERFEQIFGTETSPAFPGGLEAYFGADPVLRERWFQNPTADITTLFTPRPSPARVSEPMGPAEPPRISFEPGRMSVANDPAILEEAARAAAAREPAPPPVIDVARAVPNAAESIVINGNDGDTMHREPPSSEPSDSDIPEDAWRSVYDRHGYDFLRNFFGNRPWFVRIVTRVCNAALTPHNSGNDTDRPDNSDNRD